MIPKEKKVLFPLISILKKDPLGTDKPLELMEKPMNDVAYPQGFTATGTVCGIKKNGKPDLGLIQSEPPAMAFGAFTRNAAAAAPVLYCREVLSQGNLVSHVLVNSGNANAATGPHGYAAVLETAGYLRAEIPSLGDALICSTGVIGEPLPLKAVKHGIHRLGDTTTERVAFHQAILTTDTFPKIAEKALFFRGKEIRMGGCAKGAGMICPNMATMLAFLTTDIGLPREFQGRFLQLVDRSFNSISVDGDMSTNDTVILLANGASGLHYAELSPPEKTKFETSLMEMMLDLAQAIVRDGEGATKLITVEVQGAAQESEAKAAARAVSNSPLVKTAFFGEDANWGRVLAAAGYSGAAMDLEKMTLEFCGVQVFHQGKPLAINEVDLTKRMQEKEVSVRLDLGVGSASWTYWTCDFSYEYVKINGSYRS